MHKFDACTIGSVLLALSSCGILRHTAAFYGENDATCITACTIRCERSLTTSFLCILATYNRTIWRLHTGIPPGNILRVHVPHQSPMYCVHQWYAIKFVRRKKNKNGRFLINPLCFRDSSVKCVHCYKDRIDWLIDILCNMPTIDWKRGAYRFNNTAKFQFSWIRLNSIPINYCNSRWPL